MKFPQSCEGVNHVHQHQENFDGQLCKTCSLNTHQEVALFLRGSSGFQFEENKKTKQLTADWVGERDCGLLPVIYLQG